MATAQATERTIEAAQQHDRGLMQKWQIKTAQGLHQPPPQLRQDVAAAPFVTQTQSQLDALAERAEQLFPE